MKNNGVERRKNVRIPLDTPYLVKLQIIDGQLMSVMLIDLSRGGIQVAVSPNQDNFGQLLGLNVLISNLPYLLDRTGNGCLGQVVWVSSQRCGIRLARLLPLTDWQIQAIVHEL